MKEEDTLVPYTMEEVEVMLGEKEINSYDGMDKEFYTPEEASSRGVIWLFLYCDKGGRFVFSRSDAEFGSSPPQPVRELRFY